jgi:methylase of polypeptide subunit release factors
VLGRLLASGGAAILETGHDQAAAVACLARRAGFQDIEVSRDLAGAERCLRLSRQGGAARKKVLGNQAVPV